MKNLTKFLFLAYALLFINSCSNKESKIGKVEYLSITNGFKIFKLGDPITNYNRFLIQTDIENGTVYEVTDTTQLSLGAVDINTIKLKTYKGIVSEIAVIVTKPYKDAFVSKLINMYGEPKELSFTSKQWLSADKKIKLNYDDSNGIAIFTKIKSVSKTPKIGTRDYLTIKRGFDIFKLGTSIENYSNSIELYEENGEKTIYDLRGLPSTYKLNNLDIKIQYVLIETYKDNIMRIEVIIPRYYKDQFYKYLKGLYGKEMQYNKNHNVYTWETSDSEISLQYAFKDVDNYVRASYQYVPLLYSYSESLIKEARRNVKDL